MVLPQNGDTRSGPPPPPPFSDATGTTLGNTEVPQTCPTDLYFILPELKMKG